jgi:hypothetical protein
MAPQAVFSQTLASSDTATHSNRRSPTFVARIVRRPMLMNRETRGPEAAEGRMTAATACRTCGTEPREGARFCDGLRHTDCGVGRTS